jgi:hypothetical protein
MAKFARRMMIPMIGVLVLSGAVTAVANASPRWYLNGEPVEKTKSVTWKGSITMSMRQIGSIAVKCEETATGTVSPGGVDEIVKLTTTSCTNIENCKAGSIASRAAWPGQLVTEAGVIHDHFAEVGITHADVVLKCEGHEVSECSISNPTMTNANPNVVATFSRNEVGSCSEGTESRFEGQQTIKLVEPATLQVKA